ncbi:MAG: hypothetical protein HY046_06295 [Acidobacteria bacterium]|nr:hypothetical protein [Acidobacteriota bacterium]
MTGELNYFNYFSEIEEHFWRKRGAHLLVSPLDWAILETWQKAGIPIEAVLSGIDRAFESYARSKRASGGRPLKSLAYCVDAVLDAYAQWKEAHTGENPVSGKAASNKASEAFTRVELRTFFERTAARLLQGAQLCRARVASLADRMEETARKLAELSPFLETPGTLDLEDFERRLTVLEDKLSTNLFADAEEVVMLEIRRELDRALAPYRRKMSVEQLESLERQFLKKRLFERYDLPRLSLFYLT